MNPRKGSTGKPHVVEYAAVDTEALIVELVRELPKGKGLCVLLAGESEFEKLRFAHAVARKTGRHLHVISTSLLIGEHLTEMHANLNAEFEKVWASPPALFFSELEALLEEDLTWAGIHQIKKELAFLCRRASKFEGITFLSLDTHGHIDERVLEEAVEIVVEF